MNNFPKECGPLSGNPLSLPLQINHVDWPQAPFPGRLVQLLVITQIYKHGDYEPCCPFCGA